MRFLYGRVRYTDMSVPSNIVCHIGVPLDTRRHEPIKGLDINTPVRESRLL